MTGWLLLIPVGAVAAVVAIAWLLGRGLTAVHPELEPDGRRRALDYLRDRDHIRGGL